jgi:hypothetical protein
METFVATSFCGAALTDVSFPHFLQICRHASKKRLFKAAERFHDMRQSRAPAQTNVVIGERSR